MGKEVQDHLKAATEHDAQHASGNSDDESALIQKLRDEVAAENVSLSTQPLETGKVQ